MKTIFKNIIQLILLSMVFFSALTYAHSEGHDKPQTIQKEEAIKTAKYHVKRLIEKNEIDKSWEMIKESSAKLERINSRMSWNITYNNPEADDVNKNKLVISITNTGYFISSSVTGKSL